MPEKISITRRVIMVKVKTKPNQRHENPTPSRPYVPERKTVPVLFDRLSTPRVPIDLPVPWWSDWKAITLATSLILLLLCAVYLAATSSKDRTRQPSRTQQEILKPPPEIQIRPMGYASSRRSLRGEIRQGGTGTSAGNSGLISGRAGDDRAPSSKRRAEAVQSSDVDELILEMLDQNQKLILPSDIAGSCNLGNNSIKDLSSCLVLNGARAVRK